MSESCQPVIDIVLIFMPNEYRKSKSLIPYQEHSFKTIRSHYWPEVYNFWYKSESYDLVSPGRGSLARPTSHIEVKLPWYKSITWKDIRDIIPSLIILFIGLCIMILVIPYAFSSVIKQLQQEAEIKSRDEMDLRNRTLAENQDQT